MFMNRQVKMNRSLRWPTGWGSPIQRGIFFFNQ